MIINDIIKKMNISKYRLSKISSVPFATISDICTGKARIEKCSAETLYKLAKALNATIETLIEENMEYRVSFETFKSTVCHHVKNMGDINYIINTLESGRIRILYNRKWFPECLYLLAMVDYLSRENSLPLCNEYDDIRSNMLSEPVFPSSVIAMSAASHNDTLKNASIENAIPEFKRFNIIESKVRDVC